MGNFFDELIKTWNLDLIIVAIVLLSGLFQERFLGHWNIVKDARLCAAIKTLIVSLVASSIYIFFSYDQVKSGADGEEVLIPWGKYFISFFAATSLYDFVVRPFRKWIAKVTGEKDSDPNNN